MSNDRGMKKWLAYRSLNEAEDFMALMHRKRQRVDKPLLSSDKAEEIDRFLQNYEGGLCLIVHYDDGFIYKEETRLIRIDAFEKRLITEDNKKVPFKDLLDIRDI